MGIGFGMTTPGLMSAASLMAGSHEQGRIAGLFQATMSAGYVVDPISANPLYELERSYSAMLALGAALLAMIFVLVWLVRFGAELGLALDQTRGEEAG